MVPQPPTWLTCLWPGPEFRLFSSRSQLCGVDPWLLPAALFPTALLPMALLADLLKEEELFQQSLPLMDSGPSAPRLRPHLSPVPPSVEQR